MFVRNVVPASCSVPSGSIVVVVVPCKGRHSGEAIQAINYNDCVSDEVSVVTPSKCCVSDEAIVVPLSA